MLRLLNMENPSRVSSHALSEITGHGLCGTSWVGVRIQGARGGATARSLRKIANIANHRPFIRGDAHVWHCLLLGIRMLNPQNGGVHIELSKLSQTALCTPLMRKPGLGWMVVLVLS